MSEFASELMSIKNARRWISSNMLARKNMKIWAIYERFFKDRWISCPIKCSMTRRMSDKTMLFPKNVRQRPECRQIDDKVPTNVYPITIFQFSNSNKYITRKTINEDAVTYLITYEFQEIFNSLKYSLWVCYNGNVLIFRYEKRESDWFPLSCFWRRERDSNPRCLSARRFSRPL